jgi:hypothetical protein
MPILHENEHTYIYDAIINGKYKTTNSTYYKPGPVYIFDPTTQVYKYSNTLYPNKTYTKIFDPSFMKRGDIINFGGEYRNENKLIYDGKELLDLWTKVDDYGSVPPNFVAGDNEGEFNIGDFEDIIDHNSINWLSKEKLQQIEIYEKNNKIKSKVTIRGKLWNIRIDIDQECEFNNTSVSRLSSVRCFFWVENDTISMIKFNHDYDIYNKEYLITTSENLDTLKNFVSNGTPLLKFCLMSVLNMQTRLYDWYIFKSIHEYKSLNEYNQNIKEQRFPYMLRQNLGGGYYFEHLLLNKEHYDQCIKLDKLDTYDIKEVECHPIKIELIKKDNDTLLNQVKDFINEKIENYDDIKNRIPFNVSGDNTLEMYL